MQTESVKAMDFLETYGWNPGSLQRISSPPEKSWIWSDLHLSNWIALQRFRSPFRRHDVVSLKEMNDFLLKQWRDHVAANETIIFLGDVVSHRDTLADEALVEEIRSCPGQRVLVIGNHDLDNLEALRNAGFEKQYWGAVCDTDPPLVLTHEPHTVKNIPPGTVHVHGHHHIHKDEVPAVKGMWRCWTAPSRRINVVVELTDYAPVRLSDVVTVARERLSASRGRGRGSTARGRWSGWPTLTRSWWTGRRADWRPEKQGGVFGRFDVEELTELPAGAAAGPPRRQRPAPAGKRGGVRRRGAAA